MRRTFANVREIHIYDLDGTVIDSSHRYRTIRNPDGTQRIDLDFWRENSHKAMQDSLLPLADQMIRQCLDFSCAVIVATARVMGPADWEFMRKHFPLRALAGFCHRPADCNDKGGPLKVSQIQRVLSRWNLDRVSARWVYEDNADYLDYIAQRLPAEPVFVPSKQGY